MSEGFIGLSVCGCGGIEESARACRDLLEGLCSGDGCTYERILYPYADSLLLYEREGFPAIFGARALLCRIDRETIESRAASLFSGTQQVVLRDIRADAAEIRDFLAYKDFRGGCAIGGFQELVRGAITPWSVREHSRKFCSFCEHISRLEGVELLGLDGGWALVKLENAELLGYIKKLYAAKTGGIMELAQDAPFCRDFAENI